MQATRRVKMVLIFLRSWKSTWASCRIFPSLLWPTVPLIGEPTMSAPWADFSKRFFVFSANFTESTMTGTLSCCPNERVRRIPRPQLGALWFVWFLPLPSWGLRVWGRGHPLCLKEISDEAWWTWKSFLAGKPFFFFFQEQNLIDQEENTSYSTC